MKFLNYLYQHINILSLDVMAGAVAGSLFFAHLLDVTIPVNVIVTLALTVWIIYTLDHLRDAMTIPNIASTDRHRFHQKHFRLMCVLLMSVVIVHFVMIWFISQNVLKIGLTLGLVVSMYLVLQRYLKFLKEVFVASLYTAGILLPSLAGDHSHLLPVHYLIIFKFFVTALMNLLLFSLFDYNDDRHHRQHSFVTSFGPESTRYGIILMGLLNIFSGFWLWGYDPGVALVFIFMNMLLLGVLFFRKNLAVNNYYRMLGDAVFFIPGLYLLCV